MSDSQLLSRVKTILSREWELDPTAIPDDAALGSFERWDSLGHITVLMALADETGLALSVETVQALTSIPKIVAHLAATPFTQRQAA